MFEKDLAYAYLLGTALLHMDNVAEGQHYVNRIFGAGDSAKAHLLLGMGHTQPAGLSRAPSPSSSRAVKLNPKLPTVQSLYGRALLTASAGRPTRPNARSGASSRQNVNDFEANLQLGHVRRKNAQRLDDAAVYLERAISIRPNDLTARSLLASLRLQTGKTDEARGDVRVDRQGRA